MVVWVESAEVVAMFLKDALETVSTNGNGPEFYAARGHQPAAPGGKDKKLHTVARSEHAGTAFIAKLCDDKITIVLANLSSTSQHSRWTGGDFNSLLMVGTKRASQPISPTSSNLAIRMTRSHSKGCVLSVRRQYPSLSATS